MVIKPWNDIQEVVQCKIDVFIIGHAGNFGSWRLGERVDWSVMAVNDEHRRRINYLDEIPSSQRLGIGRALKREVGHELTFAGDQSSNCLSAAAIKVHRLFMSILVMQSLLCSSSPRTSG